MQEIWNVITTTFTKIINFVKEPLLFTILFISILGTLFSALIGDFLSLIVFVFFILIIIEMIGEW